MKVLEILFKNVSQRNKEMKIMAYSYKTEKTEKRLSEGKMLEFSRLNERYESSDSVNPTISMQNW